MHLKPFLSLWYIWCKPCTYHAPKLTLSPKVPKGDSTWPTSPRNSIECVQNNFWGYGTLSANCGSILHWDKHYLQMDQNKILHDPHHLGVPSGASKMISELTYVQRKPCNYLESRLALYPNRPKRASIWASHLGVPSSASKTIYKAMVYLVQTIHQSCTETNTGSKRTEKSFHLSLVT
jgi:hypothetical protein